MGVDLRLLPFDRDQGDFAYSHTILELGRNYDLQDEIRKLRSMPVPPGFVSFSSRQEDPNNTSYGVTTETPYGEPVEYVLAGDLCGIKLSKNAPYIERAIWAYLKCLPPETKVALFWH